MGFTDPIERLSHLEKCRNKKWYESEHDVNEKIIELGKKLQIQYGYYQCPFCRLWHVTKKLYSPDKRAELWRKEIEYQSQITGKKKT